MQLAHARSCRRRRRCRRLCGAGRRGPPALLHLRAAPRCMPGRPGQLPRGPASAPTYVDGRLPRDDLGRQWRQLGGIEGGKILQQAAAGWVSGARGRAPACVHPPGWYMPAPSGPCRPCQPSPLDCCCWGGSPRAGGLPAARCGDGVGQQRAVLRLNEPGPSAGTMPIGRCTPCMHRLPAA